MQLGKRIQRRAKQLRVGPTELAQKISTSKPNIYTIFKRDSMDVQLLMQLSEALEYNFFIELAEECENLLANTVADYEQAGYKTPDQKKDQEIKELKERYSLLKELYVAKHGQIPNT